MDAKHPHGDEGGAKVGRNDSEIRQHEKIEAQGALRDEARKKRSRHRLRDARLAVAGEWSGGAVLVREAVAASVHETPVANDRERSARVTLRKHGGHRRVERR